jgi:hypothetical protein
MSKWPLRVAFLALFAGVGIWAWHAWFPSPEQVIRRRLAEMARLASFGPNEGPLAKMMNAEKLAGCFSEDVQVQVDFGGYPQSFSGRQTLREAALRARSMVTSLQLEFPDIIMSLGQDRQSAVIDLAAKGVISGEAEPQVHELKFTMKRVGGDWLITRVETVKTLL